MRRNRFTATGRDQAPLLRAFCGYGPRAHRELPASPPSSIKPPTSSSSCPPDTPLVDWTKSWTSPATPWRWATQSKTSSSTRS